MGMNSEGRFRDDGDVLVKHDETLHAIFNQITLRT